MKKQVILVGLTFLMLVGCGHENMKNQSDFSSSTTEKIRTSGKDEKTSESKEISSKPSEASAESSRESRSGMADVFKQNELLYASTLDKLKSDQSEGHAQVYTFYDIDDNGTAELLTGHLSTNGDYYLAAIYYLNQGVSTYLAQSRVALAGGSRESAMIYTDGTVFYACWHSLHSEANGYLYKLRSDNTGFDIEKEGEFQVAGVKTDDERSANSIFSLGSKIPLDLTSLPWKEISSYSSNS